MAPEPAPLPRRAEVAVLLCAGFCFGGGQQVLLREFTSLLYGEEVVLLLVATVALAAASLGYRLGERLGARPLIALLIACASLQLLSPGLPRLLVDAAMLKTSPDGRSYKARIDALRTEKEMNALFEDMISEFPNGKTLLSDYNPVRTAGPMQVSVAFAEEQVKEKAYPYPRRGSVRNEVFTRRGGVYFGVAILLDYPVPYSRILYRFADFNAGRYSSRNAAFQAAVSRLSSQPLPTQAAG